MSNSEPKRINTRVNDREVSYSDALLRYPHTGKIIRCTDRGFGFLSYGNKEIFIHVSGYVGSYIRTLEGLEGKYCAFVIGGNPTSYKMKKTTWENEVVQWMLLESLSPNLTPEQFARGREKILSENEDKLYLMLSASWYIDLWKKSNKKHPQAVLRPDPFLDKLIKNKLNNSEELEEVVYLLSVLVNSPWYIINKEEQRRICNYFFQLERFSLNLFLTNKSFQDMKGYVDVWPLLGKSFEEMIKKAKVVAIDLEANKKHIFQYGWKNANSIDYFSDQNGISKDQLKITAKKSLCKLDNPYIVGHNLINWDIPILIKNELSFFNNTDKWDTLISSWIIEPWKESHALIVKKNGHRADADADASYHLFEKHVRLFSDCEENVDYDLLSFLKKIHKTPKILGKVKKVNKIEKRVYPSDFQANRTDVNILPKKYLYKAFWQRNCQLKLFSNDEKLLNPILTPTFCKDVANEFGDIFSIALSLVVSDAYHNGVEVRLSSLPPWLLSKKLEDRLLNDFKQVEEKISEESKCLYLAEDLFKLNSDKLKEELNNKKIDSFYWPEILLVWQKIKNKK